MRQECQLRTRQITPGARITISQLNEIDGPIKFRPPGRWLDARNFAVNLNERPRSEQRVHGEIARTDVAILGMAEVQPLE